MSASKILSGGVRKQICCLREITKNTESFYNFFFVVMVLRIRIWFILGKIISAEKNRPNNRGAVVGICVSKPVLDVTCMTSIESVFGGIS